MRKIPTLYRRDWSTHKITNDVTPGCEWVMRGEGKPTRKYDGTAVMLDADGKWWGRRVVKKGKATPTGFVLVEFDPETGHAFGWEPIEQSMAYKHFLDALEHDEGLWEEVAVLEGETAQTGTYELCGPKINNNPEGFEHHRLIKHSDAEVIVSFWNPAIWNPAIIASVVQGVIREVYERSHYEGIVWHHPDGRMAKLKAKDL